jgi:hypothetical protein
VCHENNVQLSLTVRVTLLAALLAMSMVRLAGCASADPSASKRDALADQVLSGKGDPFDVLGDKVGGRSFVFVVDPADVDGFVTPPAGYESEAAAVDREPSPFDGTVLVASFSDPEDSSPTCAIDVLRLADPSRYPYSMPDEVKTTEKALVQVRFGC